MKVARFLILSILIVTTLQSWAAKPEQLAMLKQLQLPAGFKISIFADHLPTARSLALGDNGIVYVGSRDGNVWALQDNDGDGLAEQQYILAKDLYMPNGVAYKEGSLYVAEVHRIIRFDAIGAHLSQPPQPVVVFNKFPTDKRHGWKYLRFGPDGKLYTAIGMPCNICKPENELFGTLVRLNADGSEFEILAKGIRNSVGFTWEPTSGQLYFNDNGRDYLGDNLPPEELNLWSQPGQHFGFPYCHAGIVSDPEFGGEKKCAEFSGPVWTYKAHIAPLGMHFYTGTQFPAKYRQQLLVAQHGSWNRTEPQGYQIAMINFKNGKPQAEQVFINGWLTTSGEVLGRPVDILQTQEGSLLISDDKLGVIYKVEYKP
ncbi:PQQ-dependent sugar dehydrogenase [Methylomonas sp. AM2-LC]|uniref:PQQ-dependent sugar dehydrogenase n=1 Tax=Methylomonas sp. AM2-LC TaxID=3153301 RepID=UPI003263CD19